MAGRRTRFGMAGLDFLAIFSVLGTPPPCDGPKLCLLHSLPDAMVTRSGSGEGRFCVSGGSGLGAQLGRRDSVGKIAQGLSSFSSLGGDFSLFGQFIVPIWDELEMAVLCCPAERVSRSPRSAWKAGESGCGRQR